MPADLSTVTAEDIQAFLTGDGHQGAKGAVPAPTRRGAMMTITGEDIQAFLTGDGHHSSATRRRRYSTLCALYRWLIRHEIVEVNPMERLDPIEQVQREPRPLQPEMVTKILQAIPASNLRDRALFTLLYE